MQKALQEEGRSAPPTWAIPERSPQIGALKRTIGQAVSIARERFHMLDIDGAGFFYTCGQGCARYKVTLTKWVKREAWQRASVAWAIFEWETNVVSHVPRLPRWQPEEEAMEVFDVQSWKVCGERLGRVMAAPARRPGIILLQEVRAPGSAEWPTCSGYIFVHAEVSTTKSGVAIGVRSDFGKRYGVETV